MSAALQQVRQELTDAEALKASHQEAVDNAKSMVEQADAEFEAEHETVVERFAAGDATATFPDRVQHDARQEVRREQIKKLEARARVAERQVTAKREELRRGEVAAIDAGEPDDFRAIQAALGDLRNALCKSIGRQRFKERELDAGKRHWITYVDRYGPAMEVLNQLVGINWPKELRPIWLPEAPGFGWVPYNLPQVAEAEGGFREALRSAGGDNFNGLLGSGQ